MAPAATPQAFLYPALAVGAPAGLSLAVLEGGMRMPAPLMAESTVPQSVGQSGAQAGAQSVSQSGAQISPQTAAQTTPPVAGEAVQFPAAPAPAKAAPARARKQDRY